MIRLDTSGKPAELAALELPEFAITRDGQKVVPVIWLRQPGTATERAAHAVARGAVPGRDEGEDDAAYRDRLQKTLAAYGADALIDCELPLSAVVEGAVHAIALTAHAKALIARWEHFGDSEGGEIEPSALAIEAAMRHPRIADRFQRWVGERLASVTSEGNGSAPSANTSSRGARKTAGTAKAKARRVSKAGGSTPSATTKASRPAISARKSSSRRKPSKGRGSSS